ncbi:NADH-ubiquinone oxidoreductase 30.4 kDa subunit [Colletotrichum graminicola]|uniref:NADH-ubiquinone oxidoreductase 30.4 kDa subunit n=1 Tax=Colletotrichum graminicola (strain M1.001 / M2 / FGSC 10212) TaxID=645133 RepID=E3QX54_COLGM|nr:NADH-ubiquinone oxidoreductase 30.4 kDa subunit [Colletotrichum graminicola M1.001]EFQ35442.1 NADH-ubiquinone oxidoreductase 30.4 kDa subunit [Colletotrichum graminicola M1.001]WDK22399.1 NADH-ubiquinone oxidoreductase 30.4 kDa subunit [Colletotrichum graminicola]
MVKRKRSREDDIEQKLADYRKEIFRALKGAKGLERQRYSKRLRDDKATPDKVKRLEREILVLKSLDLQQTADAHLHSSLLKVKQIAESPALPESIKQGIPKPDLSEDEKAALHNVTSGLFNRVHVREAIEKAVRGVCLILNVPIPEKKKKGKKAAAGDKNETEEDQPREAKKTKVTDAKDVSAKAEAEVSEEEIPFDEMDDEIPPDSGASDGENNENMEEVELDEDSEERAVAKFEAMLGSSDSEDGSGGEDLKAKYQALLGEVAEGDTADDESNSDEDDEGEDEDAVGQDDSDSGMDSERQRRINAANVSLSPSPEPASRKQKKQARAKKPTGRPGETTFLPSLMGGYISNSESEASDLDLAPPKKRLGQKQRQAIWEKKYGAQANHVKKQTAAQRSGVRDSGWDMKRGAVGGEEDGPRKPWKKGVSNPLGTKQGSRRDECRRAPAPEGKPRPPPKRDDEGVLHPSWQARKKAKEEQTMAAFQGTKITF